MIQRMTSGSDTNDSNQAQPSGQTTPPGGANNQAEPSAAPQEETRTASEAHEVKPSEPPPAPASEAPQSRRGAAADFSQGLGLMFQAAKKVVGSINTDKLEALGVKAADRLDQEMRSINSERINELGKKAWEQLNPERIESIASEAGKELLNVVERVSEQVESVLKTKPEKPAEESPPQSAAQEAAPNANEEARPEQRESDKKP